MAKNSNIQWTNATFNPWIGCTKVSAECAHCYAETQDKHRHWTPGGWGKGKERKRTSANYWKQPLAWNKQAVESGTRPRVFCASLADVFDAEVPDEWRDELFALIALTPSLDWLLLTKRPQEARRYLTTPERGRIVHDAAFEKKEEWPLPSETYVRLGRDDEFEFPLDNMWIGTSVEDQKSADERIPYLVQIPASVHFLSCEPLLGFVDLEAAGAIYWDVRRDENGDKDVSCEAYIDWVIAGGESGPNARPMHPNWARGLRDQCIEADIAFFYKQWGEWVPKSHAGGLTAKEWVAMNDNGEYASQTPCWNGHDDDGNGEAYMLKVGKKAAGRLLDGCEWNELPLSQP